MLAKMVTQNRRITPIFIQIFRLGVTYGITVTFRCIAGVQGQEKKDI